MEIHKTYIFWYFLVSRIYIGGARLDFSVSATFLPSITNSYNTENKTRLKINFFFVKRCALYNYMYIICYLLSLYYLFALPAIPAIYFCSTALRRILSCFEMFFFLLFQQIIFYVLDGQRKLH